MEEGKKVPGKGLSVWQLTMLALGTVVGGSFFLGSSVAIRAAGPSVLIAYVIGGVLVYWILTALSEMTVENPSLGSFRTYAEQAFGPGAGFTVGWVYWIGMVLAMSSEATAASILIRGWFPWLSLGLLEAGIIVAMTLLNLLGADRLSKLESSLAAVKLLAVVAFVVLAILLAAGIGALLPGGAARSGPAGFGVLAGQPLMPGGVGAIAGSMLIVMFSYAGFEVLGLAASETANPKVQVPKAIRLTLILLVGLFLSAMAGLFFLVPGSVVTVQESPFVTALSLHGLGWAGNVMDIVLVSAILSTMLASIFGLGRMLRSLADEGHTPAWMRDKTDVPYRGILFSGASMLTGLGLGLLLPQGVYLFLLSSGGFSILFVYTAIMASHYRLRRKREREEGARLHRSALRGFPYTSWLAMLSLAAVIVSMPLIPGQGGGLAAGLLFVALFAGIYAGKRYFGRASRSEVARRVPPGAFAARAQPELSEELTGPVVSDHKGPAESGQRRDPG